MRTLQRIGWRKVAALTEEGQQYSDYIPALQDKLQNNKIEFVMNRKFPAEATDMKMVRNEALLHHNRKLSLFICST
jgi:hypothetical protein